MKFVAYHRSSILEAFNQAGYQEVDFAFVKRRGRIHIKHQHSEKQFAYLRIKETVLDENRQWKHTETFKIKLDQNKEYPVGNWDQLMEVFKQWLKDI